MKKLRILGIVVFVIAAVSFGYFKYEQINSKDNQAPVITMDADSVEVSCQAGDEELSEGNYGNRFQRWRCNRQSDRGIHQ